MSLEQIDTHFEHLRDTFNLVKPPPTMDEDYLVLPADDVDKDKISDFEQEAFDLGEERDAERPTEGRINPPPQETTAPIGPQDGRLRAPDFSGVFPGIPDSAQGGSFHPPSDAYAFYLPFHLFYQPFWGIYLIAERVAELTTDLHTRTRWTSRAEMFKAVRFYLFKHEYFHQKAEAFSARLEVSHRTPVYLNGQWVLYRDNKGTDELLEEALAEAYALRELKGALSRWKWADGKQREIMKVFVDFVRTSPPGYRRGADFFEEGLYEKKRSEFAEAIHDKALNITGNEAAVWDMFGHGFRATGNIKSRVNYIVHENSSLAQRMQLGMKRMSYGKLRRKLRNHCGCEVHREGKGSHVIWKAPSGETFTVPRHPRDLATGTLSSIVKAACNGMNLHDFMRA